MSRTVRRALVLAVPPVPIIIGVVVCLLGFLPATGCAQYQVPGGAASFGALGITEDQQTRMTDASIRTEMRKQPAANFPATIATVRVQDRGYRSHSAVGFGRGSYSIVTVRDVEQDTDVARFLALPMIRNIVPLNRLVIDERLDDEEDLRAAAARVQSDMLLIYTFDTRFGVETTIPALGVITLGLFPNDEARVTSTASAALVDTRTGFVYALAEGTASTKQLANAWTNDDAVDQSRRRAEGDAYNAMLDQLVYEWKRVAEVYAMPRGDTAN